LRGEGPHGPALTAEFFARDTVLVARDLLGCILETNLGAELTSGRITEVEAYIGPDDPAAHGYGNRRTQRNAAMFGPPGRSYVYFIYGMHWCFNAVTEREGFPAAILVRSLEPLVGLRVMARRRGTDERELLCSGPARLCQALGITGELNGCSLTAGPVRILETTEATPPAIVAGPRIGVSRASDWPLRFCEHGSQWLSRPEA
jgi:DNA-3-methyladenine glycosylase